MISATIAPLLPSTLFLSYLLVFFLCIEQRKLQGLEARQKKIGSLLEEAKQLPQTMDSASVATSAASG